MNFNIKTMCLTCLFMILLVGISFADLTNGLLVYYKADETTGNLTDALLNYDAKEIGTVGTINNGIINSGRGNFLSSNYFNLINPILKTDGNGITVSLWYNASSNWEGGLFDFQRNAGQFKMDVYKDGAAGTGLRLECIGSGYTSSANIAPIYNNWTHIVAVYNGTHCILYQNNVSQSPVAFGETGLSTTGTWFGKDANGNAFTSGYLDEIGIWNRTLSYSEISQLYNNGNGLSYPFNISTNPITINSINITAQYSNYSNTTDLAYWDANNLTCSVNQTGAENISYSWYKNNNLLITNYYCYQETTNNININDGICNLNYSGTYELQPNYFYINYTKPKYSTNLSKWLVKHGIFYSNLTIPFSCWNYNYNKLILRMSSNNPNLFSSSQCFNGSWIMIENISDNSYFLGGLESSYLLYDGNFNTCSGYTNIVNSWLTQDCSNNITISEEGMNWNIENISIINLSIYSINDNMSCQASLQNGSFNINMSKNITILPPQVNYINIINSSGYEKQNLLCNYSVIHSNMTIIDWLVNNTVFKQNSNSFNITDYNNSMLSKNLQCRLNETVSNQYYTFYNYSNNITIGQNITFTAKSYLGVTINNFTVCYYIGCYNTTSDSITIWNYNDTTYYNFSAFNYQNSNVSLTTNIKNQSYQFNLFDAQSINFSFYNQNFVVINNVNVRFYSLTYNTSYNYSTTNGNLYVSLLASDTYQILSSSTGYATSQIFMTITPNSYQTKNIYLINNTIGTLVTYTVLFSDSNYASGHYVKILKYDSVNQSWAYLQECITNDVGVCQMYVIEPDFYRYVIYDSTGLTVGSTTNEFVTYSVRDPFIVQKSTSYLQQTQYCQYLKSKSSPVSYVAVGSNLTYNFSLAANWNIADISTICMKLTKNTKYTYYSTEQTIFNNCLSYANINQIYNNNVNLSKDLYTEIIYANVSGTYCQINQGTIDLRGNTNDSTNLIFVLIGAIFVMSVGIFLHSIEISMILEILWIALCSLIGWLPFTYTTLFGLVVIIIVVIMFLRRG